MSTVSKIVSTWVVSLIVMALMIRFIPIFGSGWPETALFVGTVVPLVFGSAWYVQKKGI